VQELATRSTLVATLTLFLPALPLAAQENLITIGSTNPTGASALPFGIAERKGLFKKEGLNAATVIMQNAVVVNGVLSRNLELRLDHRQFHRRAKGGLPVRVVMSLMDGSDHALVATSAIKRVEDLKGTRIGISSFGGSTFLLCPHASGFIYSHRSLLWAPLPLTNRLVRNPG